MKKTEETWLIDIYDDNYIEYSKKINRFLKGDMNGIF